MNQIFSFSRKSIMGILFLGMLGFNANGQTADPVARTFSDDFNRDNGDLGPNYETLTNALEISDNRVTGGNMSGTSYMARVKAVEFGPDQEASVTWTSSTDVFALMGVLLRSSGTGAEHTSYSFTARRDARAFVLQTVKGDKISPMVTVNARSRIADGDVLKGRVVGNVISLYLNDLMIHSFVDSTITVGQPGLVIRRAGTANGTLDNFLATEIGN
jgi:hypothetical protein